MRYFIFIAFFIAGFSGISAANATVDVSIDLSHQRMNVTSSSGSYSWPISTARAGYVTPRGVYRPQAMYRMTYSRIYGNAPMPHAIFFNGGYAIHGTYSTGQLGQPASHGCVRLAPGNAAALYDMVKAEGARITIAGAPPASRVASAARGKETKVARSTRGQDSKHARGKSGQGSRYAQSAKDRGTKHARATRGHGTRYARNTRGKSRQAVAQAAPQSQPAPQDMFGLFGGGF